MSKLIVNRVLCEYKTNPIGISTTKPRFSWEIESDEHGTFQTAYQVQVALNSDFGSISYDSSFVDSEESVHVEYSGPELNSQTRYYFRIKIKDNFGRESEWSATYFFETGFLDVSEWRAKWITPDENQINAHSENAFYLRRPFTISKPIKSARAYVTGVGLYEMYLNDEKVGDDYLTPGWTSYSKRLQYQVYDVTAQIQSQGNSVGVILADGWYKGNLAWERKRDIYGNRRGALVQLTIHFEDGTTESIVTDESWKASTGPILFSEIYHGETFDARLEQEDWCRADFDDSEWASVSILDLPYETLIAQENNPVRVVERIAPISSFTTPEGDHVLDMGQNMVGRIRFDVEAPAGTEIVLKHAEILDRDGNIYFGNLRKAKQTIKYITKGNGPESFAPHFTFQGFRYVKVEGYPGETLPLEKFTGEVMHSDMEEVGHFESSHPLVNQLQKNIKWGQRGNFVDVPTDCPQRDERLGWTGDAQVFVRTALFNYQGGAFFTKWLRDLRADQLEDGGVPFVIPNVLDGASSSAWGDAAVICPWTVYLMYGDTRILAEQYGSMKAWVEYIRKQGKDEYLWNTGFHFGDWLGLDAKEDSYFGATPNDLVSTAYYAYSTRILRDTAEILNKKEDAKIYGELFNHVKDHFNKEFVTPFGRMAAPTQTAHVLALIFNLVDGKSRERIAHDLNELVIDNDYHLTTGFVGTPYICFALTQNGYHQTALKLLLQESYPSWLYPITKGATTIWEHWDGIKLDGSFWSDDMNSFNHYAYGAIGDWLYREVAGLDLNEVSPGFKDIRIAPHFGGREITYAKASIRSLYGQVVSAWEVTENTITVEVKIPANTTAVVSLPYAKLETIKERDHALSNLDVATDFLESTDGCLTFRIGSGTYQFVYPNPHGFLSDVSLETRLIDVLNNQKSREFLIESIPFLKDKNMEIQLKKLTFGELIDHTMIKFSKEMVENLVEKLNKLEKMEEQEVLAD